MNEPLELTESKKKTLPITNEQAQALMSLGVRLAANLPTDDEDEDGNDRTVISCVPTQGSWNVTVRNLVGLIGIGSLQLRVNPKIPTNHLIYLLQHADAVPRDDTGATEVDENDSFVELLARWFNMALGAVLVADPLKDYRSLTDDLATLRGRIRPLPTARNYYAGRHRLTCDYDEFDTDTPVNRVLKAAAQAIAAQAGLPAGTRADSRRHLRHLGDVSQLQPSDLRARPDIRMRHYRNAHRLAHLILRGAGLYSCPTSGKHPARTLLFYTPAPVEQALRNILSEGLKPDHTVTRKTIPAPGLPGGLSPDLYFDDGRAIGDVKYKLIDGGVSRPDLYQAVTFATGAGTAKAAVFAFSKEAVTIDSCAIGPVSVKTIGWLTTSSPRDAHVRFIDQTYHFLRRSPVMTGIADCVA